MNQIRTTLSILFLAASSGAAPASAPVQKPAPASAAQTKPKLKSATAPLPVNIKLNLKGATLKGYVDLHAHPMSYLGFGRKAMHGAPGLGAIIPAGTRDCNSSPIRAGSIDQALGHCNSTHGGWGLDNTCGDYLRAGIINYALDDSFVSKVGFDRNPHGDHEHAGYPDFRFWPHQTSILHQQMWWEWIRRAYEGGLRVMVALTVNSEMLAEILNGDGPYDDKSVADTQIDEMVRFVNEKNHGGFMEIARSADEVREIVSRDKLAIVLGMEVDKLGNFGKPGVATNEAAVRAEIRRLYGKGIRYAFPIHLIDNSFGGTAVYSMLFNFANRRANGSMFHVTTSADPYVKYSAALTSGPLGFENGLILGARGFLEGLGQLPAPCFNDAIKCQPFPPGVVRCCGSYQNILNIVSPSPELDLYKFIRPGHVNAMGLTRLGEVAINEMMKLGMLIDIDHMSERSMTRAIEIAELVPGKYPLVMGHNKVRPSEGKERDAPGTLVQRLAALGGMFGVGTADATAREFIGHYQQVWTAMKRRGVAIGTDADGFEKLPRSEKSKDRSTSDSFYTMFTRDTGLARQVTGNRTWDYVLDGGVTHYGLLPEFLYDVKSSGSGNAVMQNLLTSAEDFAQMWKRCEATARSVAELPSAGTYTYNVPPTSGLCPHQKVGGDSDFGGHGPRVAGKVVLGISPDGTTLQATVTFDAKETQSDWSEVRGNWTINVGDFAPPGLKYSAIVGVTQSLFDQTLVGGGRNEVTQGCDGDEHVLTITGGPVARLVVVGDTGGGDISNDNDCNCDTRIVRIEFNPITATTVPR